MTYDEALRWAAAVAGVGGAAGIASALRSGEKPDRTALAQWFLTSATTGLIVFGLLRTRLDHDPWMLAAISVLAAAGGGAVIDFLLAFGMRAAKGALGDSNSNQKGSE